MTIEKIQEQMAEFADMTRTEIESALANMGVAVHHTTKRTIVHVDGIDYEPAWFDYYCDRVVLVEA